MQLKSYIFDVYNVWNQILHYNEKFSLVEVRPLCAELINGHFLLACILIFGTNPREIYTDSSYSKRYD